MQYQLISTIPGVTVRLTQNPLNAKIEISETAKRVVALLIWTEHLVENYFLTAGCYLTSRGGKQVDGVYVPDKPDLARAASWLEDGSEIWNRDWHGETNGKDKPNNDSRVERILQDSIVQCYLASLNTDHCGDCTCVSASCERCHIEDRILGINTLPHGKHVNYRLSTMYFNEYATPESKAEKVKRDTAFASKMTRKNWTPDESTKKRWSEESALAEAAYQEHQLLYRQQEGIAAT